MADVIVEKFILRPAVVELKHIIRSISGEGIKEHLQYLTESMQIIKSLQRDVERSQAADQRIAIFGRIIIDLIYRVEDAIESLNFAQESRGVKKLLRLAPLVLDISETEAEIDVIRSKMDYLIKISRSIWISGRSESLGGEADTVDQWSRQTFGHQTEDHFVGRVEEMKELGKRLIEDPQSRVILICGMGGIGKTALAQRLYQDPGIKRHFGNLVAWVHVSQVFNRRRVLEEVYAQLWPYHREDTISGISGRELATRVGDFLRDRRCLVVLDDVWSWEASEAIRMPFPSAGMAGKLLITTRELHVARAVGFQADETYIHSLRYLTADEGSELFGKRVDLHTHLQGFEANEILEMGKETVKYCGGLPLAIISFLKLMESKRTQAGWKIVRQNLDLYVRESQQIGNIESTMQSLSLSYENLPDYLKPCFLYLGCFQRHSTIDAEILFLFWVAEGLISIEDSGEDTLEDAAERYLYDLAERKMVEVHKHEIPTFMRVSSCQLNPFLGDLSLSISERQGFFKIVNFDSGHDQTTEPFSQNQAYRLAINFDDYEVGYDSLLKDIETKHVRCLLFSAKECQKRLVWPRRLSTLAAFKYLKILDFDGFDFRDTELPQGLGKLVYLRYLSFRGCILPELPTLVGNLRLLVLDLRVQCQSEITLPNMLEKLKKLMHLFLPESFTTNDGSKLRLRGLRELQSIINFNSGKLNFQDLFTLPKLRYVASKIEGSIREIEQMAERIKSHPDCSLCCASLDIKNFDCYTEDRHFLFRLLLGRESLVALSMEGHLCRIPDHTKISQNLAKFILIGSELVEDPMRILEQLPKLCVLVLDDDAFAGRKMTCSDSGFIGLKQLELLNLKNLKEWVVEEGAMPQLSNLAIINCRELIMQPQELEFVERLSEVKASRMHEELKRNLRQAEGNIIFED